MLRSAALAALALLSLLLVACGGGASDGEADPATAVPRSAAFYAEVAVRPDGALRDDTLAAAGKVLRTNDPEARIRELVDRALASGDRPADYEKDIAPWLGERAGLWVSTRLDEDEEPGVVGLVTATDTDLAVERIEASRSAEDGPTTTRSHGGVDYEVDRDGFAYGAVEDFIAFGDERELKQTIDAVEGGALAGDGRYRDAIAGLPRERLAHFFLDTRALVELGTRGDPEGARAFEQIQQALGLRELPPLAGSFAADGERLALDVVATAGSEEALDRLRTLSGGGGSTPLLAELPADAWGAYGVPNYGETLRQLFALAAGGFGGPMLERQLREQTGLDLEEDVFSWIGDVAVFVRGETLQEVDGALVIEVTDEDRASRAFGKLVGILRTTGGLNAGPVEIDGAESAFALDDGTMPRRVVLARGNGRVVAAWGEQAAADGLEADETLGDSETFGAAEEVLGGDMAPTLLVSMPALASLVDGAAGSDPGWAEIRPYLESFDVLAAGGTTEGEQARGRLAVGLAE